VTKGQKGDGLKARVYRRSANEKEYAGIPDLPRRDRLIELEFASVSDRKIRGQLRNVDSIEKQVSFPFFLIQE
jgi:hypothetical protein